MTYTADWRALRQAAQVPQWLRDGKFGIYTHWGPYSVHGQPGGGCWYPHNMYNRQASCYKHHVKAWGDISVFGYKDFIPLFKAEHFNPDEWAELFKAAGAVFAGPVGEHHDGFAMWDTALSEWNAAKMGPKRDIVAELEKSIRGQGMKYMVALHHAENWFFYPHWIENCGDLRDPRYAGLYGDAHDLDHPELSATCFNFDKQSLPSEAAMDKWLDKTKEVIDRFAPDLLWFDFGITYVREDYRRVMAAYYYNEAKRRGQDVALTYKNNDMAVGSCLIDVELGGRAEQQRSDWLTDTTVEKHGEVPVGWSYTPGYVYKEPVELLRTLVDNISKNGFLLLNVGPKPDGSIPEEVQHQLRQMGKWLGINGEAVYGTTPWLFYGEGPAKTKEGDFGEIKDQESAAQFTAQDFRYTAKGSVIYTFAYVWAGEYLLTRLKNLHPGEVKRVTLLHSGEVLPFQQTREGLRIGTAGAKPCNDGLFVMKIERE